MIFLPLINGSQNTKPCVHRNLIWYQGPSANTLVCRLGFSPFGTTAPMGLAHTGSALMKFSDNIVLPFFSLSFVVFGFTLFFPGSALIKFSDNIVLPFICPQFCGVRHLSFLSRFKLTVLSIKGRHQSFGLWLVHQHRKTHI